MAERNTVLYIDDEPINLMLFQTLFNKKYNVLTAISGFEGLEILKSNSSVKVVISDLKMPEMDGFEFIVRAKKEYPNVAYFIFTGYNITQDIASAIGNGLIIQYFSKPLNEKEINEAIEKALK